VFAAEGVLGFVQFQLCFVAAMNPVRLYGAHWT
jgi:hypothetical protein